MIQKIIKLILKIQRNNTKIMLIMVLFFLLLTPFVFAQSSTSNSSTTSINTSRKGGDNILKCNLVGLTQYISPFFVSNTSGSYTSSACELTAVDNANTLAVQNPGLANKLKAIGLNPNQYVNGGGLGLLAQIADSAYAATSQNGPDAVTFIADHINPNRVSAQSSALQGLSPILVLWGTLRNVTYVLIALSLVVTGLTMYFRRNQGKQDNFNVATSISDIVFTLVTITLSYVIAGIAVDLVINLGNVAIGTFFQPFINSSNILSNLYTPGSGTNIFSILNDLQNNSSSGSIINIAQQGLAGLQNPLNKTGNFIKSLPLGVGTLFTPLAGVFYGIAQGVVSEIVTNELLAAILSFTIFIIIFRIVFLLLGSFVGIILTVGFAPLILIPGAFPGPSANQVFTDWLKRVLSFAIVFPVIFGIILLASIFLNLGDKPTSENGSITDCKYDNSSSTPITIPGTGTNSDIFKTTRFNNSGTTTTPSTTSGPDTKIDQYADQFSNTRNCYPILLPPKFNWLPAPIGNLGDGFDIDDFTRFVVGLALIVIAPNIAKAIQDALKVKPSNLASAKDALAGAGVFNTFIGQIPVIGKPITQITGGIVGAVK